MGCFLACFGSSKNRKHRKPVNRILPRDQLGSYEPLKQTLSLKQDNTESPIFSPLLELKDKPEEKLSLRIRKKVTFDLNVKTYEIASTHEVKNYSSESDEEKERGKKKEKIAKASQSLLLSEDDSITSMGSYPSNHRYKNCRNNYDEDELIELEESDLDDDDEEEEDYDENEEDGDQRTGLGDFSESFFSVESRARISATSIAEKEVNSSVPLPGSSDWELKKLGSNWNARDRSKYVHSVLNPVENLTQWKTLKARATPPLKHQKENLNIEQETQRSFTLEPGLNLSPFNSKPYLGHSKPPNQEIAVDASLSNWLISSQTTPITKTSTISVGTMSLRSKEDRPILGALTVEELKKLSASSCPRRSPSRSPEDKPILGTVGGYWSHAVQAMDSNSGSSCEAIPNTTSKYREYKKVIWKSTPFQNKVGESYEQRCCRSLLQFSS